MISNKIHIILAVFVILAAVQSFGLVTSSLNHVGSTTLAVHIAPDRGDNNGPNGDNTGPSANVNPPSQAIMYKAPSLTPKH